MDTIPDILADRYASPALRELWSGHGRIRLERQFWLAVLEAQSELGLAVDPNALPAYRQTLEQIDPVSIRQRELRSKHDVKARIEEWNALAGHEEIHKGLTSRDLTENVEQLQIYRSLSLIRDKAVAVLAQFHRLADTHREVVLTARTHNVAAQPTLLGKRLAMYGEEWLRACARLRQLLETYPARGLKGAVGTQLDQLTLFAGDADRVAALEARLAAHLGLPALAANVGQVYPRSLDLETVETLHLLACPAASFATTLRLMAGLELATEGFLPGQTGSSAMPHKMNARSCERIGGFKIILGGYLHMAGELAGSQWNEGDVSCSVVRRVLLPDSFFAIDGLLETLLTVLRQLEFFPEAIERELARYLPLLSTTTFLMEAVKAGAGREQAHAAIKAHAIAAVRAMRQEGAPASRLIEAIAADPRVGLDRPALERLLGTARASIGLARQQIDSFLAAAQPWLDRHPEAAAYQPSEIL